MTEVRPTLALEDGTETGTQPESGPGHSSRVTNALEPSYCKEGPLHRQLSEANDGRLLDPALGTIDPPVALCDDS